MGQNNLPEVTQQAMPEMNNTRAFKKPCPTPYSEHPTSTATLITAVQALHWEHVFINCNGV